MRNRWHVSLGVMVCGIMLGFGTAVEEARATFHLWDIVEVYSNTDGSIQFVEFRTTSNSQNLLAGHFLTSNAHAYMFPNNLPSSLTANHRFLVATSCFAALPNVPTPDYIFPANFLNPNGDTLSLRSTATSTPFDTFAFGAGQLPTNCTNSLICSVHGTSSCTTTASAVNSPTNFAGASGSVVAPVADLNGDCQVNAADLAQLLGSWGPCPGTCPPSCPADLNGDCATDAADLAMLLGAWFSCP